MLVGVATSTIVYFRNGSGNRCNVAVALTRYDLTQIDNPEEMDTVFIVVGENGTPEMAVYRNGVWEFHSLGGSGEKGDKGDKGDPGEAATDKTFINVSYKFDKYDFTTKQEARDMVLATDRNRGQIITYQLLPNLSDKVAVWVVEQFVGNSIEDWNDPECWSGIGASTEDDYQVYIGGRADSYYGGARYIDCMDASTPFGGKYINCGGAE